MGVTLRVAPIFSKHTGQKRDTPFLSLIVFTDIFEPENVKKNVSGKLSTFKKDG